MALSKTTQDHEEIRQWAESRGGKPAEVESTEQNGQTGILRLEFPGATNANDSALKEISWDEFFEKFDASGLALVYQEETADGEKSNFNKLIHPESATPSSRGAKKGAGASAKKSSGGRPAKKVSAKAPAQKSLVAKKASGKAAAKAPAKSAKKSAVKKAPAKKTSSKQSPGSKPAAKKSAAKKTTKRR